jgi:genome maintenance exonuclease 1
MSNNRAIFVKTDHELATKMQAFYEANPYGERKYYGVTKVLSETKSEEDKASLQAWRDKVGEEKAEAILQESLKIGNSLDMMIEKFLAGTLGEIKQYKDEPGLKLFYQMKPVLENIDTIGLQIHMYSDKYKIQGYLDCIGVKNGVLTMIDFKNSRSRKSEKYIRDYFLQASIYCLLIHEMTGIVIKDIMIILGIRDSFSTQIATAKLKDYIVEAKERISKFNEIKGR